MKYFPLFLILLPFFALAQSEDPKIQLNRPQWNKTINKAFLTILGAKTDNSAIGNYASLDPAAGSFTFKGSIPVGKEESTHISYLSLSINGDLISDTYSALFSNSKLNTNAGIQAEWHVRLGKNHFIVDKAEIAQYTLSNGLLKQKMLDGVSKNISENQQVKNRFLVIKYQKENIGSQLRKLRPMADRVKSIVDSLFLMYPIAPDQDKKKWTDSLIHITSDMDKQQTDSTILQFKQDSLSLIIADLTNYGFALDKKVIDEYNNKKKGLDTLLTLKKVEFNWFTIVAGGGKKKTYSFQDNLIFSDQIKKNDLTTWKLGLVWNYFNQNKLSNHAYYVNVGVLRTEENNANLLSTSEISQERTIKNAAGDTVRKISQKYSAYTEAIVDHLQWNIYGNYYYLFGKRTSGFHFFPSLYVPDRGKGYANAGLGYIISFINNKKDQPVINTEGYIQLNDVFNSLKLPGAFWNRNEIGIRFSLPISLLSK